MPASSERVQELFADLSRRPGHETVKAILRELLTSALGVPSNDARLEVPVPEVRGRIDALFGETIFEVKSNLARETADAEAQLQRYLRRHQEVTGRRCLGIATDGAAFVAYELAPEGLRKVDALTLKEITPGRLLHWLDTALAAGDNLPANPDVIRGELGRDSLVFRRTLARLTDLWEKAQAIPEAALKRDLWHRHLEFVYGTLLDPQDLFLQHTYLSLVGKILAVRVLSDDRLSAPQLLDGTPFVRAGIEGAVEADFFDWPTLLGEEGHDLIERLAVQVSRFRLAEIEADVLKALYESLIEPRQRHYLGEYYTPDWLAGRICTEAVATPLSTRCLDPACGSGTFLFHLVRRHLNAAKDAGMNVDTALQSCTTHVAGLDVHPVAVLFARVTYLLAIGPELLKRRKEKLTLPVFLGDALQWNVKPMMSEQEVLVDVPGEKPLRFPGKAASDPILLDSILHDMDQRCGRGLTPGTFRRWLNRNAVLTAHDRDILVKTYAHLLDLHQRGRDHIWKYVIRNLTRPLWLSQGDARVDLLIGNPPWLRYNAMSKTMQTRLRDECRQRDIWVGGKLAAQQDLSAYFFARSAELYLHDHGRVAFVMPRNTLVAGQYARFRSGHFGGRLSIRFERLWSLEVQPLFPVAGCVLFASRAGGAGALPKTVLSFRGRLNRRDATPEEAEDTLAIGEEARPIEMRTTGGSPYRALFHNGATIWPRRLFLVTEKSAGRMGRADRVTVEGRTGSQDKKPWKDVAPPQGAVERRFLRPVISGESAGPYRVFEPLSAVLPWDEQEETLLSADAAAEDGSFGLADWLERTEALWQKHGNGAMSLLERLDYYRNLTCQFPTPPIRVIFPKSGTHFWAAILEDPDAVVDNNLYWAAMETREEAQYLCAIFNSEPMNALLAPMQVCGQSGRRHFDKIVFNIPVPRFNTHRTLHHALARHARDAEQVAQAVDLPDAYFTTRRRLIRKALEKDGIGQRLDDLVEQLLNV